MGRHQGACRRRELFLEACVGGVVAHALAAFSVGALALVRSLEVEPSLAAVLTAVQLTAG